MDRGRVNDRKGSLYGLEYRLAVLWSGGVRACDRQPDPRLHRENKGLGGTAARKFVVRRGAILSAYHQVANWALHGDMAAIQDVVPTMASRYTIALLIGIVLNLLVLVAARRRKAE